MCSTCKYARHLADVNARDKRNAAAKNEATRRRYAEDPAFREAKSRTRRAHRERSRDQRLLALYRITGADYDALLAAQGGTCALCEKTPETNGCALSVDHCHRTGRVRGLLCAAHNLAIGALGDDWRSMQRAADYLAAAERNADALETLGPR